MSYASNIFYYLVHSNELLALLQWKTLRKPMYKRDESIESNDMKQCFRLLDFTSQSFAPVIKELHPELRGPICIFYLILRGLDTVEDDMTIDIDRKEPMLRSFYTHLDDENWTFSGNGPIVKDRELLVNFHYVTREFLKIKDKYKTIVRDVTKRMGNGMADYAINAIQNENKIETIQEYELYCYYVAGTIGDGLTRMFVGAEFADPQLLLEPQLAESMAQFLQHTNIIRDMREDYDDKRYFWPKEVWSQYVDDFTDLFEPANKKKALQCSSHMILLALQRASDCLLYMAKVHEQSVFCFVAILQSIAMATLELCFQNPEVFQHNMKISKGSACQLMMQLTTDSLFVYKVFRKYAQKIRRKNKPSDPIFSEINIVCEKIERCAEDIFRKKTASLPLRGNIEQLPHVSNIDDQKESRIILPIMLFILIASSIIADLTFN